MRHFMIFGLTIQALSCQANSSSHLDDVAIHGPTAARPVLYYLAPGDNAARTECEVGTINFTRAQCRLNRQTIPYTTFSQRILTPLTNGLATEVDTSNDWAMKVADLDRKRLEFTVVPGNTAAQRAAQQALADARDSLAEQNMEVEGLRDQIARIMEELQYRPDPDLTLQLSLQQDALAEAARELRVLEVDFDAKQEAFIHAYASILDRETFDMLSAQRAAAAEQLELVREGYRKHLLQIATGQKALNMMLDQGFAYDLTPSPQVPADIARVVETFERAFATH